VVLLWFGVGRHFAAALLQPLGDMGLQVSPEVLLGLSLPLACFVVIAATNATNLLDGLDGLCTGVTGIITLGFFAFALRHAVYAHIPTTDPVRMIVALSMLGAVLGFLPYNFNPASIFLGDAGSVLLGFFAAAMMLLFTEEGQMRWLLCAVLIFGLPIFDTSLAFVRRLVNHQPIFAGDRSHFYDQLVDRGMTVVQTVLTSYGLALVFIGAGLGLSFVRTRFALPIFLGVVLLAALATWRLGFVRRETPEAQKRS
jgi:UDP-GlcNAc:undecaprenyl-phosphate GlcNAc-1-phosphate transferase